MHIEYFWALFNFIYYIYNFCCIQIQNFKKKIGLLNYYYMGGHGFGPGVVAPLVPLLSRPWSQLLQSWYPILLITVYNISDFVGKSLAALYLWQSVKSATWACIIRLLFYPLFSACLRRPHWLRTEVPVVALTFMLGLTNGYLTSVLMIMAPKTVHASEAELAAVFMVVFLGIGLVCGSVLGWVWLI